MIKFILTLMILVSGCSGAEIKKPKGFDEGYKNVFKLNGPVNNELEFLIATQALRNTDDSDVLVIINTQGGSVRCGENIYKTIKSTVKSGRKLICVGVKQVASMGFNIMSRCDERYTVEGTKFMMHEITYTFISDRPYREEEIINAYIEIKNHNDFYSQVISKPLDLTPREVRDIMRTGDTYFKHDYLFKRGWLQGVVKLKDTK